MNDILNKKAEEYESFEKWFKEYQRLGGIHRKEVFAINLDKFFEITLYPMVYGILVRGDGTVWEDLNEVWDCWFDYVGDQKEARKYFDAVDNITPYS
jgi:hypothetical protein